MSTWGVEHEGAVSPVGTAVVETITTAAGPTPLGDATRVVREVARRTNMLWASARVAVVGDGPVPDALTAVLTGLGARVARTDGGCVPATTTVLVALGAPVPVDGVLPGSAPLLVVTGADHGLGDGASLRDGILAVTGGARPLHVLRLGSTGTPIGNAPTDEVDTTGSSIADPGSWPSGERAITWAAAHMPVTTALAGELAASGTLAGRRIALNLVLEPKTAMLALALAGAGAEVTVSCRAGTTSDDVAAALVRRGVRVFARSDATPERDREHALALLDTAPEVLVDDGSSVLRLAHTDRPDVLAGMVGASEETTSGLRPLRVMAAAGELAVPVIAANDAACKTLFDNGYGTGESCVMTILDMLDRDLDGAIVAVAGYGYVGRGVARVCRALGAHVLVTEVDPVKALEATFAGHEVAPLLDAAARADLVISATGITHTIDVEHLQAMRPGTAVAVAGGVRQEIALDAAVVAGAAVRCAGTRLQEYAFAGGPTVLVLDEGGCLNCTAGEGNPIEIMDLSFGVQLVAVEHLLGADLAPGVHPLPAAADDRVARARLAAGAEGLDTPSGAQLHFLARGAR